MKCDSCKSDPETTDALKIIAEDTHSMTLRKPIHNVAVKALKALSEVRE